MMALLLWRWPEVRRFREERQEEAFHRYFALISLPFDIIVVLLGMVCSLVHVQLALEGLALGCSGPGWFQGQAMNHFLTAEASSSLMPTLSVDDRRGAAGAESCNVLDKPWQLPQDKPWQLPCKSSYRGTSTSGQCHPPPSYPCDASLPTRMHYAVHHWTALYDYAQSHHSLELLWPQLLDMVMISAINLLVALFTCTVVMLKWYGEQQGTAQANNSSRSHTPPADAETVDPTSRTPQTTSTSCTSASCSNTTAAESSSSGSASATTAPDASLASDIMPSWLLTIRTWVPPLLGLAFLCLVLIRQLTSPLPAELQPLGTAYAFSASAGSNFIPVGALHSIITMVGL
jgi:hypothetical protein